MKALTLTQPWATLLATGAKEYETRSWRQGTTRALIAIHAAKGWPPSAQRYIDRPHFKEALAGHRMRPTLGMIIGVAWLADILPTESIVRKISMRELEFGDFSRGRFAWRFERPLLLPKMILARGALGLWQLTDEQEAEIMAQLRPKPE